MRKIDEIYIDFIITKVIFFKLTKNIKLSFKKLIQPADKITEISLGYYNCV